MKESSLQSKQNKNLNLCLSVTNIEVNSYFDLKKEKMNPWLELPLIYTDISIA